MAALALPANLSLITIGGDGAPVWARLFERPIAADHIPFKVRTAADRNLLAAKLDAAVTGADRAVLILAEGASCFATAWWARLSPRSYVERVAGALFLDPVDQAPGVPGLLETFASPRVTLPFPSIVLEGQAARRTATREVRALALSWGSGLVASGHADSPLARTKRVIERFTAQVVDHDVQRGEGLLGLGRTRLHGH
ncbi:alpha/beta hydrolase [Sphingomonas sp. MMS12-HWE2-04]|uniref:alpha/beta hydrolase n=1 Tax=Sphingomonas sp. MMS12-HWE2-04 TaxID=3234199 RepID=UPI003851475A